MQSSSLSLSSSAPTLSGPRHPFPVAAGITPFKNLRFCGLRRGVLAAVTSINHRHRHQPPPHELPSRRTHSGAVSAALSDANGSPPKSFDYDLLIIGAGVGGHGAALHAVEKVNSMLLLPKFSSRKSLVRVCIDLLRVKISLFCIQNTL